MESTIENLPSDYLEDLRTEEKYRNLSNDALEVEFIGSELLPSACESMLETIKTRKTLPYGYSIEWIFSDDCECLGRVLYNKVIGGIIPTVYGIDDDKIFDSVAQLLCGETVNPILPSRLSGSPVYLLKFGYGGFDLTKDIRTSIGSYDATSYVKPKIDNLIKLPGHIGILVVDGVPTLTGNAFVESDQIFIRNQQWLLSNEIPVNIVSKPEIELLENESSLLDMINSIDLIPDAAAAINQIAITKCESQFTAAAKRLQKELSINALIELFFKITNADAFDAYCDALIDEDLPLRYRDETEDNEDLIGERLTELRNLEQDGCQIQAVLPSLSSLKQSSLGVILLYVHGEYPGSRHSGNVQSPLNGQLDEIVHLVAGMILHATYCENGMNPKAEEVDKKIISFVINSVMTGNTLIDNIINEYNNIAQFCQRLETNKMFLDGINQWRKNDDAMRSIRASGKYLYVGDAIPRERPKGLAELMASSRSNNVSTVVTQSLSDFLKNTEDATSLYSFQKKLK